MFECKEIEPPRYCKGCGKELPEGVYSYCSSRCMIESHKRASLRITPKRYNIFDGLPKPKHGVKP